MTTVVWHPTNDPGISAQRVAEFLHQHDTHGDITSRLDPSWRDGVEMIVLTGSDLVEMSSAERDETLTALTGLIEISEGQRIVGLGLGAHMIAAALGASVRHTGRIVMEHRLVDGHLVPVFACDMLDDQDDILRHDDRHDDGSVTRFHYGPQIIGICAHPELTSYDVASLVASHADLIDLRGEGVEMAFRRIIAHRDSDAVLAQVLG